jgi:hypothetical protein
MFDDISIESIAVPLGELSTKLSKERDEAVKARRQSGLDSIWIKAREQYQGIDEINRKGSEWSKSRTLDGPIQTAMGKSGHEDRSTVFVNITRPYTNAGVARVSNIILPTGDRKNWDAKLTPVSETALLSQLAQEFPQVLMAAPPELQEELSRTPEQRAAALDVAKALVADALTECGWTSEGRKQIAEAGKVGSGVIKGPFPKLRRLSADIRQLLDTLPLVEPDPEIAEAIANMVRLKLLYQPAISCVPVENIYPDMPGCGTDIHNGRFLWEEVPYITKTSLREYLDDETYFSEQVAAILKEDPIPVDAKGETKTEKKSYSIWIRTGEVDLDQLMGGLPEAPQMGTIFCQVEICNNKIIKVAQLPLEEPRFPYRVLIWEPRQDSWAGVGIPEQIETPQRGLNAAVRAGNDNLGWSVGFQILLRKGVVEPLPGESGKIHPYKMWNIVIDALQALGGNEVDPQKAFSTIEFPNHLDRILQWIDYWLRMAEFTTGLPLVLQGQTGGEAVGNNAMAMQNASGNLQMFVKHWDNDICEPLIQSFYDWVQKYGPKEARGDARITALGSSMLIARELQQQMLVQLLGLTLQPMYGLSPKQTMDMMLEGLQIDPERLHATEEEMQQLQQAAAQPDPAVEAAQIRAQTDMQIEQMRKEVEGIRLMLDAQIKGLSIQQAKQAVDTQAAANITQEAMKQGHDKAMASADLMAQEHLAKVDAGLDPENPRGVPKTLPLPQMSVEEALNHLGI